MASICSILSLLVFTRYIVSIGSAQLDQTLDRSTQTRAEAIGVHYRQRRETLCTDIEFEATYPCTRKEFTELPTKNTMTCVWFSQSRKPFSEASNTCKEKGSNLVKIDDKIFNGVLVEKRSSKKWWIGLQWKDGLFRWPGDSAQASFGHWQHGSPPVLKSGSSSPCVYLDADQHGLWSTMPCANTLFFICQRGSVRSQTRAALKIHGSQNDTERSTTVEMGKHLLATCDVYGGVVDNVLFQLDNQATDLAKIYDRSEEAVRFSPEARYERRSDICWKVTIVTLTLPVIIAMDNGTLYCRAILHDGLIVESPKRRINVKTPPRRPTLIVDFDEKPSTIYAGRDRIVATCVAPIGVSGSSLTWAILNGKPAKWWTWSDKHRPRSTCKYRCFKDTHEALSPIGRVMKSTLVLKHTLEGITIACLSYSKPRNRMPWKELFGGENPLRALAGPIRVKAFDPLPPHLIIRFVSQQGDPGVKIKVQCIAFVGRVKTLTWSLSLMDGGVRKVMVNEKGEIGGGNLHEAVVMGEREVRRSNKGHEISSTVNIVSYKDVENATLTCFSHKDSDKKVDKLRRSVIFHSKEFPLMTEFSVSYHKPPTTVYGNRTMKATCTASLGKNGTLTWALRTRLGEALWNVSADGKLNSGGATGVDVSARKVGQGRQKNQSLLMSSLSLVVNKTLHGASVTCRTRPGEGPTEIWNVSRYLQVEYLPRAPILVVRDFAPSVTWIKEANCSAYVGSHSVITWLLVSKNVSLRWQSNTDGGLSGDISDAVNTSEPAVAFHPRNGPRINSSVKIDVREFSEETKLVCSSDDSSDLGPTNELLVWEYINPEVRKGAFIRQFGGDDGVRWSFNIFVLPPLLVILSTLCFFMKTNRQRKLRDLSESTDDDSAREDTKSEAAIDSDASGTELSHSQITYFQDTSTSHTSHEDSSVWSTSS